MDDWLLKNADSQLGVDRCFLERCEAEVSPLLLTTREQGIL
jgi:hypothetical protein